MLHALSDCYRIDAKRCQHSVLGIAEVNGPFTFVSFGLEDGGISALFKGMMRNRRNMLQAVAIHASDQAIDLHSRFKILHGTDHLGAIAKRGDLEIDDGVIRIDAIGLDETAFIQGELCSHVWVL